MSAFGRYCCKSLFALRIKNSAGCGCDFHVKMWGTSSPDDKLTGDLGNVIEATQIGGRRSDRLMARKLSSSNFGLLQQYLPTADSCSAAFSAKARFQLRKKSNYRATTVHPAMVINPAPPVPDRSVRRLESRDRNAHRNRA